MSSLCLWVCCTATVSSRAHTYDVTVWALYPESNQRTLEEMDLLFAADSPWVWDAEKNFAILSEENPGLVAAASRGNSVVDPETGRLKSLHTRRESIEAGKLQ